jgi:glutathione S-transferase
MADDLVLYTNPMSRGRIARWMLEEVGQPYRTEVLGYGAPMQGDYRRLNPMGKVPTLTHGDMVVTECAAICAYLADAFPEAGLAPPPGSRERGAYYRWLFYGAGPTEAAVTNRALGVEVPADKSGFVGYGGFGLVMDTLEALVAKGDWLLGERFSAADVYLGSQISWGVAFGSMEKRPGFEAYAARLAARPAAQKAKALDDALMAQMEKPAR